MRVERKTAAVFIVEFESEEELREEHRVNLAHGALRLPTTESVPLHQTLLVTLRGPGGGERHVRATAVAALPDGVALAVDGIGEELLEQLLAGTDPPPACGTGFPACPQGNDGRLESLPHTGDGVDPAPGVSERAASAWDRMRALSQMEKLLLAIKADRSERALLVQDNDPRVLLSLLRNPRLTIDEVVRVAKSPFLTFNIAETILKTAQWMSSLDVRLGLIHNPKTPPAFSLRILPTLPDAEVRTIARTGTNMALKQAALRKLQGKP